MASGQIIACQRPLNQLGAFRCRVDLNVGQSDFVVDIAVRAANDVQYRLGIIVDNQRWYQTGTTETQILERELLKPRLLEAFGWQVQVILARDWYECQDDCIRVLKNRLSHEDQNEDEQPKIG